MNFAFNIGLRRYMPVGPGLSICLRVGVVAAQDLVGRCRSTL